MNIDLAYVKKAFTIKNIPIIAEYFKKLKLYAYTSCNIFVFLN